MNNRKTSLASCPFALALLLLAVGFDLACGSDPPAGPTARPVEPRAGTWRAETLDTDTNLLSIWGSGPRDVFVGTDTGAIFRFDGIRWSLSLTRNARSTAGGITGLWGTGPSNVFAVASGDRGGILRFDGSEWKPFRSIPRMGIHAAWGRDETLFVGGRSFLLSRSVRSANDDERRESMDFSPGNQIRAGWTDERGAAWIVGDAIDRGTATVLRRVDENIWNEQSLKYLLGLFPSAEALAEIADARFTAIWGSGHDNVWIAGNRGIARRHGDTEVGARWVAEYWPTLESAPGLRGLSGSDAKKIYAVGERGRILARTESGWAEVPRTTDADLNAVWVSAHGDIFVAGDRGVVVTFSPAPRS